MASSTSASGGNRTATAAQIPSALVGNKNTRTACGCSYAPSSSLEGWMLKLAKKKTVTPPVLDRVRRRLTRRLLRACTAADPRWGYYHQFAITMMGVYQDVLADLGLVGYWVVPLAETDHWIDALRLGCPDGRVFDIPDPFEEIGPPPFPRLDKVVDFFLSLAQGRLQKSQAAAVGLSS